MCSSLYDPFGPVTTVTLNGSPLLNNYVHLQVLQVLEVGGGGLVVVVWGISPTWLRYHGGGGCDCPPPAPQRGTACPIGLPALRATYFVSCGILKPPRGLTPRRALRTRLRAPTHRFHP